MSSTIPHVVMYLTRSLFEAGIPATSITTAQIILNASLVAYSSAGVLELTHAPPPAPIFAACLGSGIEWCSWFAALAKGNDKMTVLYGPSFVKVRIGAGPLTDVWAEDAQGSVVRISRGRQTRSPARRFSPVARTIISLPTLHTFNDAASSESSDESDAESDTSSSATVYSLSSPVDSPKALLCPLPSVPAPKRRVAAARPIVTGPRAPAAKRNPTPAAKPQVPTAYLYRGGVTRVMTGGVMLGPHA
ncbi:Serine-rich protein [Mycena kentingensis (nom. inval.)]|nr:Serine-rich protein [Mycena kentingensis (nom. inval.)]